MVLLISLISQGQEMEFLPSLTRALALLKRYSGILFFLNTRINDYYMGKEYKKKKKRFCFTELFIVENFNAMRSSKDLSGVRNSFLIPTVVYKTLHCNGI